MLVNGGSAPFVLGGSASAPGIGLQGNPTTGFFKDSLGGIGFASGGSWQFSLRANGLFNVAADIFLTLGATSANLQAQNNYVAITKVGGIEISTSDSSQNLTLSADGASTTLSANLIATNSGDNFVNVTPTGIALDTQATGSDVQLTAGGTLNIDAGSLVALTSNNISFSPGGDFVVVGEIQSPDVAIGAGGRLKLGNTFAAGVVVPAGSVIVTDQAGNNYKVPAVLVP